MKTIKVLFASLVMALSFTSCQKDKELNKVLGSDIRLEFENTAHTNISVSYTNINGDYVEITKSPSSFTFRVNGSTLGEFGLSDGYAPDISTYKGYGVYYLNSMLHNKNGYVFNYLYNDYLNDGGSPSLKDLALDIRNVDMSKSVNITAGCYPIPFSYGSYAYTNYYLYIDGVLKEAEYINQYSFIN
jgi:hypothetical protein